MHSNRTGARLWTELGRKQVGVMSGKLLLGHTLTHIMTSGRTREGTEGVLYETSNEMFDEARASIEGVYRGNGV